MAVLEIIQSEIAFANVIMLFKNNSVPGGGIFVMEYSEISSEGTFCAEFENNEGNDGGAMSFYEMSYISNKNHFKF